MFKKLFSALTITACLSANTYAGAPTLKSVFDDFTYSMQVEWDQKDKAFYDQKMNELAQNIATLQKNGLTNAELINFAVSQIADKNLAREIQTTMSLVQLNQMSPLEAQAYVNSLISKSQARGASWDSEYVDLYIYSALLIGGFVALIVWAVATNGGCSGGYESHYTCDADGHCSNTEVCVN